MISRVIVLLTLATNFFIDNDFYLIFTINVHLYILIMLRFSFVCFNDVLVHVSYDFTTDLLYCRLLVSL